MELTSDYVSSISADGMGNVFTMGGFYGTVDFDPESGTYTLRAIVSDNTFILKLGASGNFICAKQIVKTEIVFAVSIALIGSGNVYILGYFIGTINFNPGIGVFDLTSFGSYDVFISKLDAGGNFVWAKQLGGTAVDYIQTISLDASGNVYTTGVFNGIEVFDPSEGTFNLTLRDIDVFISKLSGVFSDTITVHKNSDLRIYPNPAFGLIIISVATSLKNAQFEVINILGDLIMSERNPNAVAGTTVTVALKAAQDIYFVKVYDAEQMY